MKALLRTVFPTLLLALLAGVPPMWSQQGESALSREIVAATYPEGTTVKLSLSSSPHLAEAVGQARVKRRRGITDVEVANSTSFGLLGMRERARMLGGQVKIKGREGLGTTVTITMPR